MFRQNFPLLVLLLVFSIPTCFTQLCSSINGLGKCSSNVFNCVFQNGYPNYFKANASTGDCAQDEFCCLNLPLAEDGSCAQRCGVSGTARQKTKASEGIKLDKKYDWEGLSSGAQERNSRIVNGSDTDKYEFCWQGGVFVVDTEQLQNNSRTAVPIYIGGASLVGQDMALTAAHVLQPFITNANFIIFVAFGFRDIRDVTDVMNQSRAFNADETPVFRVPNEMAFHSGYNDRTYENNVAIIRFNPVSCETSNICPICLSPIPANPFQPWKGTCFTSGWGATENTSVATTLQKLEMVIPYPNECIKSFMKLGLKNYDLPSTMLCADSAPGQRGGTCDRDGGSPLVCQTKYGNWELTGIVGVGINKCRNIAAPTLFTNVGYYYEWIQSYTSGIYQNTDPPTTLASTLAPTTTTTTVAAVTIVDVSFLPIVPLATVNQPPGLPAQVSNIDLSPMSPADAVTTTISSPIVPPIPPTTTAASRFQFSPPKVFLPRPAPPLDEQQKKVLAFFQERTDDSSPRAPSEVISQTQIPQDITTAAPLANSTFTVLLNSNVAKPFNNAITDSSNGAIKFFMTAGDGLIRRKQASSNPDTRNSVISVTKITPAATTISSTAASTSSSSSSSTSTQPATTVVTSTLSSSTSTEPTTVATTSTSTQSSTKRATQSTEAVRTSTAEKADWSSNTNSISNSFTNTGWNKIVFRIRPNQDNPSILSLLRERYKNSQLYTDAPSNATEATSTPPSSTRFIKLDVSSTAINVTVPVATVPPSSTVAPTKSSSTIGAGSSTRQNAVTVVISGAQLANLQASLANMLRNETLPSRPIGNSVMM